MKKTWHYHCFQYQYRGNEYISGCSLPHRATLKSMAASFYLNIIENGFKISDVVNVQFSINEETVLIAPSGFKIIYLLPQNKFGRP